MRLPTPCSTHQSIDHMKEEVRVESVLSRKSQLTRGYSGTVSVTTPHPQHHIPTQIDRKCATYPPSSGAYQALCIVDSYLHVEVHAAYGARWESGLQVRELFSGDDLAVQHVLSTISRHSLCGGRQRFLTQGSDDDETPSHRSIASAVVRPGRRLLDASMP